MTTTARLVTPVVRPGGLPGLQWANDQTRPGGRIEAVRSSIRFARAMRVVCILAFCLVLAGCGGSMKDRYAKIEKGMTEDAVVSLLGKGEVEMGADFGSKSVKNVKWEDKQDTIRIMFEDGKVSMKTIMPK